MNEMKSKLKSEKGATGLDISTGALVFILFTTVILTLYIQIYKQSALIKIHQQAMGYIVEICEDIDLEDYSVTDDLGLYKENIIAKLDLPTDKYRLNFKQEKYIDTNKDAKDIVKRINVSITYTFDDQDREIQVNKIKVKE